MLKNIPYKLKSYLLNFIQIQLIVTLISMPILIWWGMPISKLSLIGNLIFLPILTIFLILSSILFFTQLLHIPNQIFINSLETISNIWYSLLCLGQKNWLYGFSKSNFIFILLIPFATFIILFHKKINSSSKRIISLVSLLIIFSISSKISDNFQQKTKIFIENQLEISKTAKGKVNINENGLFSKKQSIDKFIEFQLKPTILQNFGTLNIKELSIKKPGIRSFKGAMQCCKLLNLEKVILPIFNIKLSKYGWRTFFELKETLQANNVAFKRIKVA